MRAASLLNGTFTVGDFREPPALGGHQVLLQVEACGICGSDLSVARDARRFVDVSRDGGNAMSIFDPDQPVVLGHEYAGRIAAVGGDVEGFAIGDRVTGIGLATEPSSGAPSIVGYSNVYTGGFAERLVVDAAFVHHVPEDLAIEHATLAEPLHVGEMHVQQSGLRAGDAAIVIGAGPIGLGAIAAARFHGAAHVVVVEPSRLRREIALKLGADVVVHPDEGDPVDVLHRRRGGAEGSVLAYETSGRLGAIDRLMHTLPHDSHIQVVGSAFGDDTIRPVVGQWRQISINFGRGPVDRPYETVLERLRTKDIDAELLITGRVGLDGVGGAFEDLKDPEQHVKIVVLPGRASEA